MAQATPIVTTAEGGFLDRFPWYVQLLVLLGVILLVLFIVDWFVMSPMRTEAAKKNQEAESLRRENQEAETIRANIADYQRTLDELNVKLDALKVRLPEEREVTNIFENAKSMIEGSGLKLVQFQTSAKDREVDKNFYTEVQSAVKAVGTYGNVQDLFRKLSAYERIVNVTDITLAKAEAKDQASGATTMATFTVTAFYISDKNRQALEAASTQEIDPKTGKPVAKKPEKKGAKAPKAPAK